RGEEDVFPPALLRRGRDWLSRATAGWVWGCATGDVGRVEQEVTDPPVPGIRRRLHIDSDRWMIQRKFSLYTIGVQVLPLPVMLEAVPVDNLPVLQLKLGEVDMYGMGILSQVLEVPCLSGANSGKFSDVFIEVPAIDEHRNRIARVESVVTTLLLVQGKDLG